ncbi:GldG family protein [Herbivorax sp. ANBcel31]|uniref:GldG family protein n=1 Tax=Herbivorax sp. ANBcel31 TaxID=3069754 RepID=UPI0027B7C19E|nr:GldG family protein [Herbivorax sp. ANBcel31]MDQ2086701.1 GldG family protein [Herbivorax sp. ANBcel31]
MKKLFKFLGSKNFKFNTIALFMMICAIVITFFINIIAERTNVIWDMTEDEMYSIGQQTKTIAGRLDEEVEIFFLADGDMLRGSAGTGAWTWHFLQNYNQFPNVTVDFIDPDTNPEIISQLQLSETMRIQKEDIVVKSGDKVRRISASELFESTQMGVSFSGEQEVTSAIMYVTSEITPTVYFLEGHRQRDLNDEYRIVRELFEINNFAVRRIDLSFESEVPEDAKILVVAAPQVDLSNDERDKLENYLEEGGNAIFLFDPIASDSRFTNFEYILEKYDMALYHDRVKENNEARHLSDRPYHIIPDLGESELLSHRDPSEFQLVMPESRSIRLLRKDPEGVTVTPLLTASRDAERNPFGTVEGEEIQGGPIDVAALSEYSGEVESKVLVLGNAYFLTDDALEEYAPHSQNSLTFLLDCVGEMYEETSDVYVMPKTNFTDTITVDSSSARIITRVVIFGVPILVMLFGIKIWLRRRHL